MCRVGTISWMGLQAATEWNAVGLDKDLGVVPVTWSMA